MIDLDNISSRDDLIKILKPNGNGIEIGVRDGLYSSFILNNCPNLKLYLLDCWDEQDPKIYNDLYCDNRTHAENLKKTIINIFPYFQRTRIIKGYSEEFANSFEDNYFDFIYIDANHSYEAAKFDINKWYQKLKKGGLFAGHDYLDIYKDKEQIFGVKQAVDEFAKENNLKIYHTKEKIWKSWFTFKN
jgi:hypothetical protein